MSNISKKICIIIPYFGKWPDWFTYFLISCKHNPGIDWYFFSDCGALPIKSKNLVLIDTTIEDFNLLASKKLQININIKYSYKVCDFKPAFGKIFEDYITGYDFWGYGDIDLIYGNIQLFVTDEILNRFDIITFHDSFVPGHLCLLKKTPDIIELYKKSSTWKDILSNDNFFSFSENFKKLGTFIETGKLEVYTKKRILQYLIKVRLYNNQVIRILKLLKINKILKTKELKRDDLKDFNKVIRFYEENENLSVFRDTLYKDDVMFLLENRKKWEIIWENGNLSEGENELIYFHFQLLKFNNKFKIINDLESSNSFKILNV